VFEQDWAGRGAAFGDLDNDGDVDAVVSNVGQQAIVLRNDGGNGRQWLGIRVSGRSASAEASAGSGSASAKASAGSGSVRSDSAGSASGKASNRDGIGARVKVVSASGLTQHAMVTTAVGYLSASDKRLIVGLGSDTTAKLVEIRWPSGAVQRYEHVKAGQYLDAIEPSPE
jgi:hypothetical protein